MVAQLRMRPEIRVVDVDESTTRELRAMRKDGQPRLMLVATAVDDAALVAAAEAGVAGLLPRCDASSLPLAPSDHQGAGCGADCCYRCGVAE
jgi:hypothetical protein